MGGTAKRVGLGVATGGLSEFARIGKGDAFGMDRLGFGRPGGSPSFISGGQDPTTVLAQTGGAPILAQIVMGSDIDDALSGFLGIKKAEYLDAFNGKNTYLSPQQVRSIKSTRAMLENIQKDRNIRQQAVDKVLADFPNIAQEAAKARAQAGGEFDEVTKGYMQQALQGTAAKYAAGGGLSSGAMNEATARVGAEQGMQKLGYMGEREQFNYNQGINAFNQRFAEVNALRDFQNTMLTGQVQQGFSAQQANLQRQFQGQAMNAEFANQRSLADQQSKNALFGSIGSLGGTILGGMIGGPIGGTAGGQIGGQMLGSTGQSGFTSNPRLNLGSGSSLYGQTQPFGPSRYF